MTSMNSVNIVVIEGAGDWRDASVDYLVRLDDSDLKVARRAFSEFAHTQCLTFTEWLIENGLCRRATPNDIEVLNDY